MNVTNIPAPRVALIDDRTGLMSREWYRFFLNLFILTGNGGSNISIDDLAVAPQVHAIDMGAITQNAQVNQRLARFDAAVHAIQGVQAAPVGKPPYGQYDPTSFCARYG